MDDLISRQDAIKILDSAWVDGTEYEGYLHEEFEKLPSAQPERKNGKWILKPNIYGVAYCSECDYELHTDNTNYCPNCGADMRERKES